MDWSHEVIGETTGRRWRWHLVRDKVYANGQRFRGSDDADRHALVHRVEKEPLWPSGPEVRPLYAKDVERCRHAVEIARRPELAMSPYIRRLLDTHETDDVLTSIWEWADRSLLEALREGDDLDDDLAESIEENVGEALTALHASGLVHSDVAPNNILRVDGIWKLADLDQCVDEGGAVTGLTGLGRYVPEGAQIGMRAERSLDRDALRLVAAHSREVGAFK